jgi:co-chaperonin GroES (HSP10)
MVAKIDEKLPALKKPNFKPFMDCVLLQPIPRGMTTGGVALPENADVGPQRAFVVAVGPGWPTDDGQGRIPMEVEVGDVVYLLLAPGKLACDVTLEGHKYVLACMRDLIGKVT